MNCVDRFHPHVSPPRVPPTSDLSLPRSLISLYQIDLSASCCVLRFGQKELGSQKSDRCTSELTAMEVVSTGALVPAVKPEPVSSSAAAAEPSGTATATATADAAVFAVTTTTSGSELDKDFLCPICMQIIKDAFLTSCGHSFCYMCIITHLGNKNDCPCCGHYLTSNQIFPNFMLDKVLLLWFTAEFSFLTTFDVSGGSWVPVEMTMPDENGWSKLGNTEFLLRRLHACIFKHTFVGLLLDPFLSKFHGLLDHRGRVTETNALELDSLY